MAQIHELNSCGFELGPVLLTDLPSSIKMGHILTS